MARALRSLARFKLSKGVVKIRRWNKMSVLQEIVRDRDTYHRDQAKLDSHHHAIKVCLEVVAIGEELRRPLRRSLGSILSCAS